jgi:hypothetical protein
MDMFSMLLPEECSEADPWKEKEKKCGKKDKKVKCDQKEKRKKEKKHVREEDKRNQEEGDEEEAAAAEEVKGLPDGMAESLAEASGRHEDAEETGSEQASEKKKKNKKKQGNSDKTERKGSRQSIEEHTPKADPTFPLIGNFMAPPAGNFIHEAKAVQDCARRSKKRRRDEVLSWAQLPKIKWPRLEEHWTDEDMAEANMVNSLMLEPPRLHPSLLAPARLKLRLVEALDLANFDDSILEIATFEQATAHAWSQLPAIVELWFALQALEL